MSAGPTRSVHPAALAITLFSLLAWGLFVPLRTHHAFHDLDNGTYTDHFSHLNAARIFPRIGLEIWRTPIDRQFRRLTPQELQAMPPQLRYPGSFAVPGWPEGKPLQQSWSHIPRLYPPGDMLLVAPFALAYHFTSLSAERVNLSLILWFLACAHLGLLLALDGAFRGDELAAPLGLFGALLVYGELMRWSGAGFYDAAGVFPLILCARYLRERRGLAALLAYCAAAALHFRAFYLAPWALCAASIILQDKQWKTWQRRDLIAVAAVLVLSICSLGTFVMVLPAMGQTLVDINPLHSRPPVVWTCIFFLMLVALVFVLARAWLDLAVLAWMAILFPLQRNTYNWYLVLLLPWLAAPVGAQVKALARSSWVGEARLVAYVVAAGFIYDRVPMPWAWLPQLVLFQN